MAYTLHARVRLTHRYVDEYAHLDSWSNSMPFKVLGGKLVEPGNGFDYDGTVKHRVIGSKRADQDKQAQALRSSLSHHGCSHEYDCCGCVSVTARVTKVKRGVFSVLLSQSRNY